MWLTPTGFSKTPAFCDDGSLWGEPDLFKSRWYAKKAFPDRIIVKVDGGDYGYLYKAMTPNDYFIFKNQK